MLLESAHRFLNRAHPELTQLMSEDQEFNRGQIYCAFEH
jgi:hypothetical protein